MAALILPALVIGQGALELSAIALLWLMPPALLAGWLVRTEGIATDGAAVAGLRAMWRDTSKASRQVLGIHLLNATAGGTAATLFVLYTRDVIGVDERVGGMLLLAYFATF